MINRGRIFLIDSINALQRNFRQVEISSPGDGSNGYMKANGCMEQEFYTLVFTYPLVTRKLEFYVEFARFIAYNYELIRRFGNDFNLGSRTCENDREVL